MSALATIASHACSLRLTLNFKVDVAFSVPDSRRVPTEFYICHPAQANYNVVVPARDESPFTASVFTVPRSMARSQENRLKIKCRVFRTNGFN